MLVYTSIRLIALCVCDSVLYIVDKVCSDCRQKFRDVCHKYETLASKVPKDQYYRSV